MNLNSDHKRVLISPLDWGLGHATRLIPVIDYLNSHNYRILLGGSGKSATLLRKLYPDFDYVNLPSPGISYAKNPSFLVMKILLQLPCLLFSIFWEHLLVNRICKKFQIDLIISDNRYGLFSGKAYSVIITHQISPVLPDYLKWTEYLLYHTIKRMVEKFDECWIPDFNNVKFNLTGKLSHRFKLPVNAFFIGLLSRFQNEPELFEEYHEYEKYDVVVIASGPEPQLSLFIEYIISQADAISYKVMLICAFAEKAFWKNPDRNKFLTIVPHLDQFTFKEILKHAGLIICRSGYSTIMDLVTVGKKAVLVPTPNQPEQEYLSAYLSEKNIFYAVSQSDICLNSIYRNFEGKKNNNVLHLPISENQGFADRIKLYEANRK